MCAMRAGSGATIRTWSEDSRGRVEPGPAAEQDGLSAGRERQDQAWHLAPLGAGVDTAVAPDAVELSLHPLGGVRRHIGQHRLPGHFVGAQELQQLLVVHLPAEPLADAAGDGTAAGPGLAADGDGDPGGATAAGRSRRDCRAGESETRRSWASRGQ